MRIAWLLLNVKMMMLGQVQCPCDLLTQKRKEKVQCHAISHLFIPSWWITRTTNTLIPNP